MPRAVTCPICKKKVRFDHPEMPFCSRECRQIDLGNWATEKYVIPGSAHANELEDLEALEFREEPGEGLIH